MSAMTIEQAENELSALKRELEQSINSFYKRTGLEVRILFDSIDTSAGYAIPPHLFYRVDVEANLRAVSK